MVYWSAYQFAAEMTPATAADQTTSSNSHHQAPDGAGDQTIPVNRELKIFYWGTGKSDVSGKLKHLEPLRFEEKEFTDSPCFSGVDVVVLDWAKENGKCLDLLSKKPDLTEIPLLIVQSAEKIVPWMDGPSRIVDYIFDGAESSEIEFRLDQLMLRKGGQRKPDSLDEYKQKLVEAIAHDVRSPLHTVAFALDLVIESAEKEGNRFVEMLHAAKDSTVKITDLMDMMVNIQRLEEADGSLAVSEVDLSKVVEEVIRLAGDPENVSNRVPLGTMILADSQLTIRALSKIVINSLRYVPVDDGKVDISAEMQDGKIVVSIHENAKALPADFLDDIFEMFARVPEEGGKFGRSFGLNFAFSRAAMHGQGARLIATNDKTGNKFQAVFAVAS